MHLNAIYHISTLNNNVAMYVGLGVIGLKENNFLFVMRTFLISHTSN